MTKRFRIIPRGVSLLIGCATFPTWNGYPGLFASLATGNPVLVKPSRRAVLPLAITVAVAREVLAEAGFSPDLVALTVDAPGDRAAADLALRPEVRLIDFTGSSAFGTWLEAHATQAVVFAEKSGVNSVVIDSTDDYQGMLRNLAFSLSLYSGQMCTTPQNLFVPDAGIETDEGHRSFDEVATDLAGAIDGLLGDPKRAVAILGGIVGPDVLGAGRRGEPHRRRRAAVARGRAPRVPRCRHPHAAAGRAAVLERARVRARSASGRSASSSGPPARTRASRSRGGPRSSTGR